jgi:hypothetical protein
VTDRNETHTAAAPDPADYEEPAVEDIETAEGPSVTAAGISTVQ